MCLSFPGQVVGLDTSGAVVDTEGRRRRASTLLVPDVAIGDWVAVAAGTIVDRLTPAEAAELRTILDRARDPGPTGPGFVATFASTTAASDPSEGERDVHPK
jgi:hydrogenase assembly chaperone HypC/HupF